MSDKGSKLEQPTLRQFIGYGVKRASLVIERDLSALLREDGFRLTTFSALALVVDNPDATQTQLATALEIERSTCVVVVDELEKQGFIRRNKVEGDRRSHALRATPLGRQRLATALSRVEDHENRLFAALTAGERKMLKSLLARVEANDPATRRAIAASTSQRV